MVKTVYKSNKDIANLGAEIKTAYEGEADTNAFTDQEKVKLSAFDVDIVTGNVEIDGDLTLNDPDGVEILMESGSTSTNRVKMIDSANPDEYGYIEFDNSVNRLRIGNDDYVAITVSANGHVGINNESPSIDFMIGDGTDHPTLTYRALAIYPSFSGESRFLMSGAGAPIGRIYYDSSDGKMQFLVNGSERVRIDDNGDVGIGTTNPGYRLEVDAANTSTIAASFKTTNVAISTAAFSSSGTTSASHVRCGAYNDDFIVYAGQTEQFRVNSSGGLNIKNIPTSSAGLNSGDVWSDSGTLKVVA